MKPVIFGGRFGWLHLGVGKHGVVLCNAFGHESVWSHKGIRRLAENLSASGISVLRFDYLGTGDSAGVAGGSDQLESGVSDVCAAIDWLKQETGITHVTLCGLRLGAAFALLAVRRCPTDGLVLLAPVIKGRVYVRELSIIHKTWFDQLAGPVREAQQKIASLNVLGQVYSEQFQSDLSALDLARELQNYSGKPASRALIFDIRPNLSEQLRTHLTDLGVAVQCRPFEGYSEFQQETAYSVIPDSVFRSTVSWIAGEQVISGRSGPALPQMRWDDNLTLETPEACEVPVRIGTSSLFGILCKPRIEQAENTVLLITNTSANVHVGDSRLSVRIAREMAGLGIASLRFDARGIGDSPPLPDTEPTRSTSAAIYSNAIVRDVSAAAAWLTEQGYEKVVSFGICSGAYAALHAAVAEPAFAGVVTVNLPSFYMPERFTQELGNRRSFNSMAGYAESVFDLSKWKKIFRERSMSTILRRILVQFVTRMLWRSIDTIGWKVERSGIEGKPTDPHAIIRALQRRGVQALLVYGAYDFGLDQLTTYFGRHGKRLSGSPSIRVAIFEEFDHALFSPVAATKAIALCAAFVKDLRTPGRSVSEPDMAARSRKVMDSEA